MYSPFQLAIRYLRYFITASNGKGHGIHSPFVFDFIIHVLNDHRRFYAYEKVERLRNEMLKDQRIINVEDFGAGSVDGNNKQRSVSNIARRAVKPGKFGQLLFRIVNYYQPSSILELGTSLGITTSYLAMGNVKGKVITCEGAPAIAAIAKENIASLLLTNVEIAEGNFDTTLPGILNRMGKTDMAFIDGNHRKEPTLAYFNELLDQRADTAIMIFDDIHWSCEMEEAWQTIKAHPDVMLTIDLFFIGLVCFSGDFKVKQHFTIRF